MRFTNQYVKLGKRYREYRQGRKQLEIQIRISPNGKAKSKTTTRAKKKNVKKTGNTGVQASIDEYPPSTNVCSPLQSRSGLSTKHKTRVFESDEDDDIEDFGPLQKAYVPPQSRKQELGPPITVDERIAQLDQIHKHILTDFVEKARQSVNKIMIAKSLRRRPISDTTLREIAIAFPKAKSAMLQIPDMDEEKFELFGRDLLKLCREAHSDYEAMIEAHEDLPINDQQPVVEISDDNDDFVVPDEQSEIDDDELDESEESRYFSVSGEAEHFNHQSKDLQRL